MVDDSERPKPESLLANAEWLRGFARKLVRDADLAEDLGQEVVLAGLANPGKTSRSWLAQVARNIAVGFARRSQRRQVAEKAAARTGRSPQTSEVAAEVELQSLAVQALLSLHEPYQTTLILHFMKGMSARSIARQSQVPVETVRTRIKRGLALVRARLDRDHGGRRGWLAPIALTPLSKTGTSALWGVALMNTKTKVLLAAALLLTSALVIRFALPVPPDPGHELPQVADRSAMQADLPATDVDVTTPEEPDELPRTEITSNQADVEEQPRLVIHVTRSDTGENITELAIALIRMDGRGTHLRHLRADQDGLATVENILPGSLLTMPRSPGMGLFEVASSGTTHHEVVLDPLFEVEGIVVDEQGRPVADASLFTVYGRSVPEDGNSPSAVTGVDGRFRMTGWEALMFVYAGKPGYASSAFHEIFSYRDRALPFVHLVLGRTSGSISGTVVDASQRPVPGVRVWLRPSAPERGEPDPAGRNVSMGSRWGPTRETTTDGVGEFRFEAVSPGMTSLRLRSAGFSQARMDLELEDEEQMQLPIQLEPPLRVLGHVTDAQGKPVDGALVSVGGGGIHALHYEAALTGPDGSYVLDELTPGTFTVNVEYPFPQFPPAIAKDLTGKAGEDLRFDPVLPAKRTISGMLLDQQGEPLAGWRVYDQETQLGGGETLADGSFELPWTDSRLAGLAPGVLTSIELVRDPTPVGNRDVYRPAAEATAWIKGRVRLPASTTTVPVTVWTRNSKGRRTGEWLVDSAGSFRLGPFPPETYSLEISGDALPRADLGTHVLSQDQELDLGVLDLVAEVPLQLVVSRSDGRPISNLRGQVHDAQGGIWRAPFYDGRLNVEPLGTGSYELVVYSAELVPQIAPFDLIAGQLEQLEVVLEPGNEVRFRIGVQGDGDLPDPVLLTVLDRDRREVVKIELPDSRLRSAGERCALRPGSYLVEARTSGLRGQAEFTVPDRGDRVVEVVVDMR